MIRSLLRMLKHITLATVAIVAAVCIAEVGLRVRRLYLEVESGGAFCELAPRPCPITFQNLPPLQQFTLPAPDGGEPVTIRTNVLGLRGPDVAVPKPAGVVRIICLGDDATFAGEVRENATFCRLVQQALAERSGTNIEVINAGVPGYCPLLSLAWARHRLAGLQPDLVIQCCDHSDVADDRRVRPLASYSADGTLNAVCHPAAASRPGCLVRGIEQEFLLAEVLRERLGDYVGMDLGSDLPAEWDAIPAAEVSSSMQIRQTWEPIVALRNLCDHIACDFVVAIVPSLGAESSPAGDGEIQALAQLTEQAGIPFLDVTEDFPQQATPMLFVERTGALSTAGHQRFAELLSWAIEHRSGETAPPVASPADVTPTAAIEPPRSVIEDAAAPGTPSPAPLPTRRRRRVDDTPEWAQ